jgi:hypothetical protein
VPQFRLAGNDLAAIGRSPGPGVLPGIPFAILNVQLFVFVNGQHGCARMREPAGETILFYAQEGIREKAGA